MQSLQVPLPALAASRAVRRDGLGEVLGDVPSSWIMVEFPKQVHLQKEVAAIDNILEWITGGVQGEGSLQAAREMLIRDRRVKRTSNS